MDSSIDHYSLYWVSSLPYTFCMTQNISEVFLPSNLAAIKKAYVLAVEILRDESNAAAAAENLPPGNYFGQGVPNKHIVR